MNLYLRDKEKYQEGVDFGIKAERALADQKLQAERERAKKEAISTARSFLGITSPEVIASKFHITVEELMAAPPHDTTPKA